MSEQIWSKPPIETIQEFEAWGNDRGPVGALVFWAVRGVESLHYLNDLDYEYHNNPQYYSQYSQEVKDIAHIRWATGTAISSLDLCAAALGREYCVRNPKREFDLRYFDPKGSRKEIPSHRAMLPVSALRWVDCLLSDKRYLEVHGARNPLTHARLFRNFFLSKPTKFHISATGNDFTVRDLVILSKELATEKVNKFLVTLENLA